MNIAVIDDGTVVIVTMTPLIDEGATEVDPRHRVTRADVVHGQEQSLMTGRFLLKINLE